MTLASSTTVGSDLDVRLLSGTIGAEIRGVDLKTDLDADTVLAVRALLVAPQGRVLPRPAPAARGAPPFAAYFGSRPRPTPSMPGLPGHPEVFEIDYSRPRELYARMAKSRRDAASRGTPTSPSWSGHPSVDPQRGRDPAEPAATPCSRTRTPPTRG